jgi:small nuclear ribonucleoprotein D3
MFLINISQFAAWLQQVYIRGSQIRFIVFPDMLRHAPMFKLLQSKNKNRGLGLGGQRRTLAMRARADTALLRGGRGRARGTAER